MCVDFSALVPIYQFSRQMVPFLEDGHIFLLAHSGEDSIILYIWYIIWYYNKIKIIVCKQKIIQDHNYAESGGPGGMASYVIVHAFPRLLCYVIVILYFSVQDCGWTCTKRPARQLFNNQRQVSTQSQTPAQPLQEVCSLKWAEVMLAVTWTVAMVGG